MSRDKVGVGIALVMFLLVSTGVLFADPSVVGQVTVSQNATLSGQPVLPNTTVFSGDNLVVQEGVAVVGLGRDNQVRLGSNTSATFSKNGASVNIGLTKGIFSLATSGHGESLRVNANGVEIAPQPGYKTLGDVAILDPDASSITVLAREGSLEVTAPGSKPVILSRGKSVTLKGNRTARAPQGQAGGAAAGAGGAGAAGATTISTVATAAAIGGAVASTTLGAIAVKRAGDASTNAAGASAAATSAVTAANAAASAAQAANTTASAALTQAKAIFAIVTSPSKP